MLVVYMLAISIIIEPRYAGACSHSNECLELAIVTL